MSTDMISNDKSEFDIPEGKSYLTISRVFDAPRERVFAVLTNPETIPDWWGPSRYKTRVDVMEPRNGGKWRFLETDGDGNEFAFNGVYHEVTAPERMIQTFEFEGLPERGHVTLERMTLEDLGDQTRMTVRVGFLGTEDRDGMVASGMEGGARETWNRFAALVEN